jgi:hypothetical protein
VGATLATLSLLVLAVLDLAIPERSLVLTSLFSLAPLIACAVLPAAATAGFGVAAVVLALASGGWDNTGASPQQVVRIAHVALLGVIAVVIAGVRVRREQRFARLAVIAEVAQKAILPTLPPVAGQVGVTARYLSAAQDAMVGGDLYDCYHSESRVRFLVGDVRGKGIAGVEQAARVIRAFRQSAAVQPTLAGVAADMGAYLRPFFDDEEFVTALLVEASAPDQLTLVSCGHPPPALVDSDGCASFLEAPAGLPLALGGSYEQLTVPWSPGDRLLMYTDGLSEARDRHGEFLPVLPLAPLLTADSVDKALDAVLDAVRRHVPRGHLADDLAVLLLENVSAGREPSHRAARRAQVPGQGPEPTALLTSAGAGSRKQP